MESAGRAAGTLNAAAQLAVSNNPSKLRRPRRALADAVLSATLEMNDEPPARGGASWTRSGVCTKAARAR